LKRWCLMACAVVLAGCTQDSPLSVGDVLLPGESIRTFEVILEPEQYLVYDTAFGLYSEPEDANFVLFARGYGGALTSRALVRYDIPRTITVRSTGDTLKVDSLPRYFSASIRLTIDTVASTRPVTFEAFFPTQRWDRATATWTHRIDSTGVRLAWAVPGGSPSAVRATAVSNGDSAVLVFDSATVAILRDTTDSNDGLLIGVQNQGARVRTLLPSLTVRARSSIRDTIVEQVLAPVRTFIFTPQLGSTHTALRVGGTPQWRGVLKLRERLDTVTVPCPDRPNCRVKLGDLSLNSASLRLQPVPSPAGYDLEGDIDIAVHALIPDPLVPLQRSPLSEALTFTTAAIPKSSFLAPNAPVVDLPLTSVLRVVLAGPDAADFVPSSLALLPAGGSATFGVAQFQAMPRMRLVVSLARELKLP